MDTDGSIGRELQLSSRLVMDYFEQVVLSHAWRMVLYFESGHFCRARPRILSYGSHDTGSARKHAPGSGSWGEERPVAPLPRLSPPDR
jgi:hypothetical protein